MQATILAKKKVKTAEVSPQTFLLLDAYFEAKQLIPCWMQEVLKHVQVLAKEVKRHPELKQ